jgi:hypothetical protein
MMEEVIVEWLREVWQTGCCSKEKRNAGFRCFQGPLNRESENCGFISTNYGSSDCTRRHGLSVYRFFVWQLTNHSEIDYVACMGSGCYVGTVH